MINGSRDELHLQLAKAKLLRSQRRALQKSEQLRLTLDSISQGIMMVTRDGRIPVINRQAVTLLDLPAECLAKAPRYDELIKLQEVRGEYAGLPMADGVSALEHFTRRNADGTYPTFERTRPNGVVLEVRSNPLPDGGFVRTFSDITHRREAQETVARLASEDSLTGLANRRLFREQLEKRVPAAARRCFRSRRPRLCHPLPRSRLVQGRQRYAGPLDRRRTFEGGC